MCFTQICSATKIAFHGRRNDDKHLLQEYHYDKGNIYKNPIQNTLRFYCLCWEPTMMDGFFQVQEASLCPEMQKAAPCHDMSTCLKETPRRWRFILAYDLFIPYLSAFGFHKMIWIYILYYCVYSEGLVLYISSKWMTLEQNMTFPLQGWKILWQLRDLSICQIKKLEPAATRRLMSSLVTSYLCRLSRCSAITTTCGDPTYLWCLCLEKNMKHQRNGATSTSQHLRGRHNTDVYNGSTLWVRREISHRNSWIARLLQLNSKQLCTWKMDGYDGWKIFFLSFRDGGRCEPVSFGVFISLPIKCNSRPPSLPSWMAVGMIWSWIPIRHGGFPPLKFESSPSTRSVTRHATNL